MENLAAGAQGFGADPERAFLTGMLSLVDVLIARPLEEILRELEIEPGLKAALLERDGPLGHLLTVVEEMERNEWSRVRSGLSTVGLDLPALQHFDAQAYEWLHGFIDL